MKLREAGRDERPRTEPNRDSASPNRLEGEGSGRKAAPNCWEVGICVFTGFMTIVVMTVTKAYIGWVGLITQRFSTEFSF